MATKTAEIMSAKDSGRTFGEEKKPIFMVEADGKTYTCFSPKVLELVGQKVTYEEVEKEWKGETQYTMKLQSGEKKPFNKGGFGGGHKADPNTMVLAYAKDLTIAMTVAGFIKNATDMQKWVKDNYEFMGSLLPKEK